MTFEEMQLILQQMVISQRDSQQIVKEALEIAKEAQDIARSNGRTIQAMLERDETDRLRHQEQMTELRHISQGLVNMMSSIDDDRPTILRKLNAIDNKTDSIIERLNRGL
jgi:hypothetical protein